MTSNTALAIAITLPLALLCIVIFIGSAIFVVRSHNQHSSLADNLTRANAELAKIQKQVASFPKPLSNDYAEAQFFHEEIASAYSSFFVTVCNYVRHWVDLGGKSSTPTEISPTQYHTILFPGPPLSQPSIEASDIILFPNPHRYTIQEICSALEARQTRHDMFQHIVTSILLQAVTLREDATSTLLPFDVADIRSLAKLRKAILTLDLSQGVLSYIASYWMHRSKPPIGVGSSGRSAYYKVIESLLEPYLAVNTDKFQYRRDLMQVLDEAVEFGKRVSGRTCEHIEVRWGNRDDVEWIVTYPALYAVQTLDDGGVVDHCLDKGAMYRATEEDVQQDIHTGAILESA